MNAVKANAVARTSFFRGAGSVACFASIAMSSRSFRTKPLKHLAGDSIKLMSQIHKINLAYLANSTPFQNKVLRRRNCSADRRRSPLGVNAFRFWVWLQRGMSQFIAAFGNVWPPRRSVGTELSHELERIESVRARRGSLNISTRSMSARMRALPSERGENRVDRVLPVS